MGLRFLHWSFWKHMFPPYICIIDFLNFWNCEMFTFYVLQKPLLKMITNSMISIGRHHCMYVSSFCTLSKKFSDLFEEFLTEYSPVWLIKRISWWWLTHLTCLADPSNGFQHHRARYTQSRIIDILRVVNPIIGLWVRILPIGAPLSKNSKSSL